MTTRTQRTNVPVPGGHAPARVFLPAGRRLPVVVLGDGIASLVPPAMFAEHGLVTIDLSGARSRGRDWWQAVAAFARRQPEADASRLVLAGVHRDVHTLRDLVPTLDPITLLLAPSWRPRPLATLVRRSRTVLEPDQRAVGADELTCTVFVPRDRPIPSWLTGVDLRRPYAEDVPRHLAEVVSR